MKKIVAILLVVCMCAGLWGCSYSEEELAEMETVESFLREYYWSKMSGSIMEIYEFKSGGKLEGSLLYSSGMETDFTGTYEIDPSSNEIEIDTGSSYTFTYSLSGTSLKLYDSDGDAFYSTAK